MQIKELQIFLIFTSFVKRKITLIYSINLIFDLFDLSVTVTLITAVTLLLSSSRNWAVTETGSSVKGCFLSRTPLTRSHPYFLVEFIKKGQSRGLGQGVLWDVVCDAGKRKWIHAVNFQYLKTQLNNICFLCVQRILSYALFQWKECSMTHDLIWMKISCEKMLHEFSTYM